MGFAVSCIVGGLLFSVFPHLEVRSAVLRSESQQWNWRVHASEEIERLGGEAKAIERLLSYVALPEWLAAERPSAMRLLTQCGDNGCRGLYELMKKSNDDRLVAAAKGALMFTQDPRAIGLFVEILKSDPDPSARMMAVAALGFIRDERVLTIITLVLVGDKSEDVRKNAALALGNLGDPRGIAPLQAALSDRSDWVCQAAREALDKLKTQSSNAPSANLGR